MLKVYFIAVFLLVVAATVMAAPIQPEDQEAIEIIMCEFLGIFGLGNSVCSSTCVARGNTGGHCEKESCICNAKSLKEVWDNLFD